MESITGGSWQEIVIAAVVVIAGVAIKVFQGKYKRAWTALQLVALIIEAASKPGTTVEDNAQAIKDAIAQLTANKPEGEAIHKAARQAEAAVLTMKQVP